MDVISALETSFKVVERLEDRRLAMELYAAARQLNDLFVSPERVSRYAALMRNGTLKTRDVVSLAHELNEGRVAATRATNQLQRITYQHAAVFRPSEVAAIRGVRPEKRLVQTEIEDLLRAYAWHRAYTHPEFGSPEEAGKTFGFDPKTPPPITQEELHTRAAQLEQSAKRLSLALDRAFDHLTAEPVTRRRAPLRWFQIVAAVIGGILIFLSARLFGAFLDPYIDAVAAAVRRWLDDIFAGH